MAIYFGLMSCNCESENERHLMEEGMAMPPTDLETHLADDPGKAVPLNVCTKSLKPCLLST